MSLPPAQSTDLTVLFVDVLGFADYTERHLRPVLDSDPIQYEYVETTPDDLRRRVMFFHETVEFFVRQRLTHQGVRALIFSDCAFLAFDSSRVSAGFAVYLMRTLLSLGIPVRMGMARGGFSHFKSATEFDAINLITEASFGGTGIVRAHRAEQCGGKGMRIFLHPSLESNYSEIRLVAPIAPLPVAFAYANAELDYLEAPLTRSARKDGKPETSAEDMHEEVLRAVRQLADPYRARDAATFRHYDDTMAALNRMLALREQKQVP